MSTTFFICVLLVIQIAKGQKYVCSNMGSWEVQACNATYKGESCCCQFNPINLGIWYEVYDFAAGFHSFSSNGLNFTICTRKETCRDIYHGTCDTSANQACQTGFTPNPVDRCMDYSLDEPQKCSLGAND
jgi:hypothetical protein